MDDKSPEEQLRLTALAVLDRIIPADQHPAFSQSSAAAALWAMTGRELRDRWDSLILPGIEALDASSRRVIGHPFASASEQQRDELLRTVAKERAPGPWPVSQDTWFQTMVEVATECYYGRSSSGWESVGFRAGAKRDPNGPIGTVDLPRTRLPQIAGAYDVIVIGAGAGGGTAAYRISQEGARVLLVDRGAWLRDDEMSRDHLANQRVPLYGHNAGPGPGNPRLVSRDRGTPVVVEQAHLPLWQNNAMTVGGGTRVYQGMAWRFLPEDFEMATRYGVPDDSTLVDWPIGYADLEPYYAAAEWVLGVAGDGAAHRAQGHRSRGYPMPPLPDNPEAEILRRGADRLGIVTGPVPLLINTVPRNDRAQCVRCGECVGFACPVGAKNGTHNTLIPLALATGNCDLLTECRAVKIDTDERGQVVGATLRDEVTGMQRSLRAKDVVVAAGAIESARLMLGSSSDHHPDGLGNRTDQVGRHLQTHLYTGAFGLFDEQVQDSAGPGVSIATCDYAHNNPGVIGGGVLANECVKLPILHWRLALPPDAPRWGGEAKRRFRELYQRTSHVFGPVQEIPTSANRVTLAANLEDSAGMPVAHVHQSLHPETLRVAASHRERAESWLAASGAQHIWTSPLTTFWPAGQHQVGTLRMGDDPKSSVVDPAGRVHGHENLWVMDGSLHPTSGAFNPVMTIYALSLFCSDHLLLA